MSETTTSLFLPVVGLIAATISASLILDNGLKTLPYFPIEISRMLASGNGALWVFQTCIVLFTLWHMYYAHPWIVAMGLCVIGVGLFNDVDYYAIHMACVYTMIGIIVFRTCRSPDRLAVVICAIVMYTLRITMKGFVVTINDRHEPWHGVAALASRTLQIMFDGKGATPETLVVLKLGGIIQWLVFGLFASVIVIE